MSESFKSQRTLGTELAAFWRQLGSSFKIPLLAILLAFVLGALVIWAASGSLSSVGSAYEGLVRGALIKQRGFSESLVATIPYILLSLAVAVGFKSGLFNIGAEGQFYIGAVGAAWAGVAFSGLGLPAIVFLPLTMLVGAFGGAIWAGIAGLLKAKTGAHEVISTMMMNYIAFRLTEFLVSGPLRDPASGIDQTRSVDANAELWTLYEIPKRLQDPLNALAVGLVFVILAALVVRVFVNRSHAAFFLNRAHRRQVYLSAGLGVGVLAFLALPPLTQAGWPFNDPADRMHIGLFLALGMTVVVWWLMQRTTLGFELRTVGANPNAAKYAGVNITRNIVLAMAISGGLAGLAGTVEVLAVTTCRCLPVFFSSGYGWDSIAISLLARNDPFGIIASSFIWGAMRNGADLMELTSGVSKYIISLLQALVLLFVAAPTITRFIFRLKADKKGGPEAPLTSGWGGSR
jgi:general nucleoside transport system permease protein